MDAYLREIDTNVFKEWILNQKSPEYKLNIVSEDVIAIDTPYCHGEVIFNPFSIIELSVVNLSNDEIVFYLHFQMNNLKHAIGLFNQMIDVVRNYVYEPVTKVLLSCSSGLTTGFFCEKLNDAAQLLNEKFLFEAVEFSNLYQMASAYDIILMAPQISFQTEKVQSVLHEKTVWSIPAAAFATYDVNAIFTMLKEDKKAPPEAVRERPLSIQIPASHQTSILVISIIRLGVYVRIPYRIYDSQNNIILDKEVVKYSWSVEDIYDIIDYVLLQHDIPLIAISLPGIINDGKITLINEGYENFDLTKQIDMRYHKRVILYNDVNAVVTGYYASQNQFNSLSFIFQPTDGAYAGIGSIFEGRLIIGKNHVAGEAQFLPLDLSDSFDNLSKTPEGTLEVVTKTIVTIISMLGPEAIVVSCRYITDQEELYHHISYFMPRAYIPEIILIQNFVEHNLLGTMIRAVYDSEEFLK